MDSRRGKTNANFVDKIGSGLFKEQQPYCNPEAIITACERFDGVETPGDLTS